MLLRSDTPQHFGLATSRRAHLLHAFATCQSPSCGSFMQFHTMPLASQFNGIDASVTHEVAILARSPHWLQASLGVRLNGRAKVGQTFADQAGYLSTATKRRCSALNGVQAMRLQAVAAGKDPLDDVAALSQESDAEEDG
jgi:hypothetical protein